MTHSDLARHCAEETEHFFRKVDCDTRYCFELFRRALAEKDDPAWEAIYQQYRPLVAGWLTAHPEIRRCGGEVQEYVNRTFERMWAAISPEKFRQFRDLRALLAYLKTCAHSAVVEDVRKAAALTRTVTLEDMHQNMAPSHRGQSDTPPDRVVFLSELREQLWDAVESRLQNDKERVVIHCLFELDLKPRVIFERYRGTFRDVREIYLIRQVVLERLRRDPAMKALAGQDA